MMQNCGVGTKIARILPEGAVRVAEEPPVAAVVHAEFTGRTGMQTRIP